MREAPQIELTISMEQLCFIIVKARELFAKSAAVGLEPGSNPSDDRSVGILEDQRRDPGE